MRSGTIFKAFDITELRFGAIPFEWFRTKIKKLPFDISQYFKKVLKSKRFCPPFLRD